MRMAPSPLPVVHEHATTSFLFSSNGSNNLSHTSSTLPKPLSLHLLKNITNSFSEDRELGRGASGRVYKGELESGEIIAVKLLRSVPGFDDKLFKKEILNNASLHHENIVRLVGFCHETRQELAWHNSELVFAESTHMAICFEYMPNGSLDGYISDECSGLDWPTCYTIIKNICVGLKYLHQEVEPPLYHLDLKPANILLDVNMMPKLADFGVSMFRGEEQTETTGSCIGTFGYMPPEYIDRKIISDKFDIFSLGVIIIKLITGPTGYTQCAEMPSEQFIDLVHEKWRNRLQGTSEDRMEQYFEQRMRCIEMALSCVDKEWHKRPCIGDIIDKLNEMEAKDQRCLDQVSAQASLLPASSCTTQETTSSKGVSRAREHGWSAADLAVGLSESVVQEALKKLQPLFKEYAKQREKMRADLVHMAGKFQMIRSILYNADEGKLVQNVEVRTWVSQVLEVVYDLEDCIDFVAQLQKAPSAAFLRELINRQRRVDLSQVEPLLYESVIPGPSRPRAASSNGGRRTRKGMPPSTGRRRSPACLHAWRCQQPR